MTDQIQWESPVQDAFEHWDEDKDFAMEVTAETGQDSDAPMSECVNVTGRGVDDEAEEFAAFTDAVYCDIPPAETHADGGTDGIGELDREAAERIVKRYRNLDRDEATAMAFVTAEIHALMDQLDALSLRREELRKPFVRRREWLNATVRPLLESYAKEAIGDGKTRSLKLAYGTLSLVKKPASIAVVDEAAALEWAAENAPDAVRRTLQKTPLNKWFKSSGEVPAGCEVTPESDTFSMKVEG